MAGRPAPVTAEVVAWAVGEDGRSVDDLAGALRIETDTLAEWVSGRALPTRGQVTALARVLHRPRALFFLPRAPQAATLPASFRHPPGDDERQVGAVARRRLRQARRVQQAVSWVLAAEPPIDMPLVTTELRPQGAATLVRDWLAIPVAEQAEWGGEYEALRAWREALELKGVLVFELDIGRDDVRGFSAWDDHAPLIVMNRSAVSPEARCFTIAHELGHLVARQDAACVELTTAADGAWIERWCEAFGAALLMPPSAVQALARRRRIGPGEGDLDDVRAMMREFRVSARAAARSLIDLGLAEPSLYTLVLSVFVPKAPPGGTARTPMSRPRWESRLRQFGPRTLDLVLSELPQLEALSVLRMEVDDVRRLAEQVPGAAAF